MADFNSREKAQKTQKKKIHSKITKAAKDLQTGGNRGNGDS
jgi:hypothetical protein